MMATDEFARLLEELLQAKDDEELSGAIQRNLTRTTSDFTSWLDDQADALRETSPDRSARLRAIAALIHRLAESGDYRLAVFDEEHPATPKEILLATARNVERGGLVLHAAVDEAAQALTKFGPAVLLLDSYELARSIGAAPDQGAHVILAELLYQTARQLHPRISTPQRQAVVAALLAQGSELRQRADFEGALRSYERVVSVGRESDDPRTLLAGLLSEGDVFQVNFRPTVRPDHLLRAEEFYREALRVADEAQLDPQARSDVLFELGRTVNRLGRHAEAIGYLEECLATRRSIPRVDPRRIYTCLVALAQAAEESAQYTLARDAWQEAVPLQDDAVQRGVDLVQLVRIQQYLGDPALAESLKEALALANAAARDTPGERLRADAYGALAIQHARTGDLQAAIDAYQTAIRSAAAAMDEVTEARWLSNLGQIYMLLAQWREADEAFRRASEVHFRRDDHLGAANVAVNEANLHLGLGQLERAAEAYAIAYVLFHKVRQPVDMGIAAVHAGRVHMHKGDGRRAESSFRYGLQKAEAAGNVRAQYIALAELAALQAREDRPIEAVATYTTAIKLAEAAGDALAEHDFRVLRGALHEQHADAIDEAEEDYRRAVATLESMRLGLRSVERRVQFQHKFDESYPRLIRLLAGKSDERSHKEAFLFSEQARARAMAEVLGRTEIPRPWSLPAELAGRESDLLAQIRRIEDSTEAGVELSEQYSQLCRELALVWDEIAAIDGFNRSYVELRRPSVPELAEVRGLLLK